MRVEFRQYPCGGFNICLTPENLKDAANLAYFNRNADKNARKVAGLSVDSPKHDSDEPIQLNLYLNTKMEKQRTNRL